MLTSASIYVFLLYNTGQPISYLPCHLWGQSPFYHFLSFFRCVSSDCYTAKCFTDRKIQEQRRIWLSSFMIITFVDLSFVHAQIIRAWVKCMKPWNMQANTVRLFFRCPCFT